MVKIKNIAVAAVCGFVLSFLISMISTHKTGTSFVRAVVFGLIFAVLSFGIGFLNDKFLMIEPSLSDSAEDSKKPSVKTGSVVNITIDDENLTEEDHAPSFDVSATGSNFSYRASKEEPVGMAEPKTSSAGGFSGVSSVTSDSALEKNSGSVSAGEEEKKDDGSSTFKPMDWNKAAFHGDDAGSAKAANAGDSSANGNAKNVSESGKRSASVKEIDALPDIGDFAGSEIGDSGDSGISVIEDSEFAQSDDSSSVSSSVAEASDLGKQNSKIIANAIRTLLKKEEM